jgi:predicted nucleic acid-binding protein
VSAVASLPLIIIDTNVLYDYFLGRDPDVVLLAKLSPTKAEIRVPEFVLFEFRGSVLRELGAKEMALSQTRALANELDRADGWNSGVRSLRDGCDVVMQDIEALRAKLDPFLLSLRSVFTVEAHTQEIHYLGDLRYVQGLPPDAPKRGVQDCRIFEAALAIARADAGTTRPAKVFLTKDADFLKKPGVRSELLSLGVELADAAGPLFGRFGK